MQQREQACEDGRLYLKLKTTASSKLTIIYINLNFLLFILENVLLKQLYLALFLTFHPNARPKAEANGSLSDNKRFLWFRKSINKEP